MKYEEIQDMLEDIKLSFGDGMISKVTTIEDEKLSVMSISIITPKSVVVFDKSDSLVHKALNESENYIIKAKDNNLIISFDIKWN